MTVSGVVVAGLAFYVTFFFLLFFQLPRFNESRTKKSYQGNIIEKNRKKGVRKGRTSCKEALLYSALRTGAERAQRGKIHDVHGRQVQLDREEIHKHQTCRSVGSGVRLGKEAILLCPRAVCPSPRCTPYKRRRGGPLTQDVRLSAPAAVVSFFLVHVLLRRAVPLPSGPDGIVWHVVAGSSVRGNQKWQKSRPRLDG